VAESCTGGGLAERLTALPGASAWMLGGVVAYANAVKESLLDVPAATLAEHGAVSRATALAMAVGVRRRLVADWGVGITGIAGPGGGSEDKPVGTVHVAVEGPRRESRSWELRLPGNREAVRRYAVVWALESLRRALAGLPPPLRGAASP